MSSENNSLQSLFARLENIPPKTEKSGDERMERRGRAAAQLLRSGELWREEPLLEPGLLEE